MATPTPPPSKPITAASSSNPRHHQGVVGGSSSTTAPTTKVVDYMVLSSAREAAGDAVYAAPQRAVQPAALHDVEFYSRIGHEFPDNAPLLSSLLYSHRSVVNDGPDADVQLQQVNEFVEKWKGEQLANAEAQMEKQLSEARQEQAEARKDFSRRDVEHARTMKRIEELVAAMEAKLMSHDAVSPGATDPSGKNGGGAAASVSAQFAKAWADLAQRHAAMDQETREACQRLGTATEEQQLARWELERSAEVSKVIIQEAVSRSVLKADEQALRLHYTFLFRHELVLRLLEGDALDERSGILGAEEKARSLLHDTCVMEFRRTERLMNVRHSYAMLLHHTEASEKGMRFNEEVNEERHRRVLFEELAKEKIVYDVVEAATHAATYCAH